MKHFNFLFRNFMVIFSLNIYEIDIDNCFSGLILLYSENHMFGKTQDKPLFQNYMIFILIAVIFIFIVLLSYFYLSRKMEGRLRENNRLISQILKTENVEVDQSDIDKLKESCRTVVLKFLSYNENRVLKKLLEHNGTVLQSEISRIPNMGKVKAHRVLKDMQMKGIITIEKYGKTNRIILTGDVKNLFLEETKDR